MSSYLPRPLSSPSRGDSCHLAPALTGVGCRKVSGTRTGTDGDDLGKIYKDKMERESKRNTVYGAGVEYPSTGADVGSQVGPAASSSHDHGHSGVDRRAPELVPAPGEEGRLLISADGQESTFVALSIIPDTGPSSLEVYWRVRTRSDDEESIASLKSNLSIASGQSRDKKRKMICTTLDMPEDLVREMRTATTADIEAEMFRRVEEIIMVAITSSKLKRTYIKPFLTPG